MFYIFYVASNEYVFLNVDITHFKILLLLMKSSKHYKKAWSRAVYGEIYVPDDSHKVEFVNTIDGIAIHTCWEK